MSDESRQSGRVENAITNADLAVSLARVEERIGSLTETLTEDIKDVKDALAGSNGRPGLLERTVVLEGRVSFLEEKGRTKPQASELSTKALVGLVGIVSSLVTIISQLVTKYVAT